MAALRIGIDTGGTFTDVAVVTKAGLEVHKLPSTPKDPAEAVIEGLDAVRRPERDVDVVHGTTVGLNAILTRKLARCAFITNEGFADLIEIGRQDRRDIYDLSPTRDELPIPRSLRHEINARRCVSGARLAKPSRGELKILAEKLKRQGVEAIAIGLLHAYAHPEDETEIARALRGLDVPITCSADLSRSPGEFERFSSAILNASIRPVMGAYLSQLEAAAKPGRLRLLRSSCGIMSTEEAIEFPARAVFSGPAGGVLAAQKLAQALKVEEVAAFDMGGTSTDVALARADHLDVDSGSIAGLPLAAPTVDVHTIGCGGGSIAYADAGGALRVGPKSAGADPGPACYGKGNEPTVTDAHVALGHIGPETLLGGDFTLDPDRSVRAIEQLAKRLGMRTRACAEGILEVAEVAMMRALLVITVEQSIDPAKVPLVAYGGAGGLHAASLARRLSMPAALVPRHPGAFSAIGLALAGESREAHWPVLERLETMDLAAAKSRFAALEADVREGLKGRVSLRREARLRYRGQGQGLCVAWNRSTQQCFERLHQDRFGFVPDAPIEVVEFSARAETPGLHLPALPSAGSKGQKRVQAQDRASPLGPSHRVFRRAELSIGARLEGPCLIEELTAVTQIPEGRIAYLEDHAIRIV